MKIVHICLTGAVTDNFSYQDNLLSKYHVKLGHKVTFIASQWAFDTNGMLKPYKRSNYINDDSVKMIRLKMKGKDNFNKKYKRFYGLKEYLKSENPDILFIHGCQFPDIKEIVRYLKKAKRNIRVYVDNHADFSNSATNWLSKNILHKILWRHYAQLISPYTTKFYGVLPARVDFLINMYRLPREKVELLVMGADDEKVVEAKQQVEKDSLREKLGICKDDFLIVSGGKIDAYKKQTLLLMEAVRKIKDKKVKLIVFGSVIPEIKGRVKELCLERKVQYVGWIDSNESYKYFSAADIVAFPGRHSVFWEQVVGQGIPMICKYWDGTTHIDLEGNVKFLYQDSAEEIQNVLEEIIGDPDQYSRMLSVAQEKGMKLFSYKQIAKKSLGE